MPRAITPIAYGTYTITATAGTLFSFGTPATKTGESFKGRLEVAAIRVRLDGTDATSAEGELLEPGDDVLWDQNMLSNMSLVRDGGTSGVIRGHWYNVSANVFMGGQ